MCFRRFLPPNPRFSSSPHTFFPFVKCRMQEPNTRGFPSGFAEWGSVTEPLPRSGSALAGTAHLTPPFTCSLPFPLSPVRSVRSRYNLTIFGKRGKPGSAGVSGSERVCGFKSCLH